MLKFRVTNISDDPRFLVEAGKLLQPGQSTAVNRLDQGTRSETRIWKIEEGGGFPEPGVPVLRRGPVNFDDEDDQEPVSRPTADSGPGQLAVVTRRKRSVPMVAAGGDEPSNPNRKSKDEVFGASTDDGDLDDLVKSAGPPPKDDDAGELGDGKNKGEDNLDGGFVDRRGLDR